MDPSTLLGFFGALGVLFFGVHETGVGDIFLNPHGLVIVCLGSFLAMVLNTPLGSLFNSIRGFFRLFLSSKTPPVNDAITQIVKLAEKARAEGGLLNLQDEGKTFAGGFLNRALNVAIASGDANETRRVIEEEVRQIRMRQIEDQNVFRTWGILAPMFGLIGTLLGIIQVLRQMSEPSKVGPAMAVAITSAFYGITLANVFCVPIAGKMRIRMNEEVLIDSIIVEGVLDILDSKPPYLIEMHLNAYAKERRKKLAAQEGAPMGETAQV